MLTKFRAQGAKFAKVIVGPDEAEFTVHEELLTYHSAFFRAALTGRFKEAGKKKVTLEEDKPHIFEFFVHWLYHDRFPDTTDCEDLINQWEEDDDEGGAARLSNMIHLYTFCDKYQIPTLKQVLFRHLFDHIEKSNLDLPQPGVVKETFENLLDNDPLCRLLINGFVRWARPDVWQTSEISAYPPTFLAKVLFQYAKDDLACTACKTLPLLVYEDYCDQNEEAK